MKDNPTPARWRLVAALGRLWAALFRLWAALFRRRKRPAVPAPAPAPRGGADGPGDALIRGAAVVVLLGVAGGAGYVSYHHFYNLAVLLGERHDMAILYPAMSDGVIVMASLVMVYCSRRGLPVPLLAKVALILGGAVTLIANVAHGWDGGTGSRLISALAPVAFVAAYELLMWLVRTGRRETVGQTPTVPDEHVCQPVAVIGSEELLMWTVQNMRRALAQYPAEPTPVHVCQSETVTEVVTVTETETVTVQVLPVDRHEAARLAYEDSLSEGRKRIGRRTLMTRWGLEQREAEEIIADVDRERVVQAPAEPPPAPQETEVSPEVRARITQMRHEALMTGEALHATNGSGPR